MITKNFEVELITPCFCAGANQAQAELRPPSIRGQLRWWFRVLGGTLAQEKAIFGGVHRLDGESKKDATRASRLVVRVSNIKPGAPWQPFKINRNDPESYIWYYASASAEKSRWTAHGNIPPGTMFTLHLLERLGGIPMDCRNLFEESVEAFLRFGCIGLRATRGLGSLHCPAFSNDITSLKEASHRLLEKHGFAVKWQDRIPHRDMREALAYAGDILKNKLRAKCDVKRYPYSPLGNSKPRHASAVHLRPVKCADGFRLLIFEAPHARVLPAQALREPLISLLNAVSGPAQRYAK